MQPTKVLAMLEGLDGHDQNLNLYLNLNLQRVPWSPAAQRKDRYWAAAELAAMCRVLLCQVQIYRDLRW